VTLTCRDKLARERSFACVEKSLYHHVERALPENALSSGGDAAVTAHEHGERILSLSLPGMMADGGCVAESRAGDAVSNGRNGTK